MATLRQLCSLPTRRAPSTTPHPRRRIRSRDRRHPRGRRPCRPSRSGTIRRGVPQRRGRGHLHHRVHSRTGSEFTGVQLHVAGRTARRRRHPVHGRQLGSVHRPGRGATGSGTATRPAFRHQLEPVATFRRPVGGERCRNSARRLLRELVERRADSLQLPYTSPDDTVIYDRKRDDGDRRTSAPRVRVEISATTTRSCRRIRARGRGSSRSRRVRDALGRSRITRRRVPHRRRGRHLHRHLRSAYRAQLADDQHPARQPRHPRGRRHPLHRPQLGPVHRPAGGRTGLRAAHAPASAATRPSTERRSRTEPHCGGAPRRVA